MKKTVGIIGGAGYTGGEAIRILLNHPDFELAFVHSNSNAGNFLYDVHTDLLGDTQMQFTNHFTDEVDALLLCVGHGDARKFLETNPVRNGVKIVDLSQDFRIQADAGAYFEASSKGQSKGQMDRQPRDNRTFVYGLPELNRDAISGADSIANPGCFATCLQLALLPMAAAHLLRQDIHISATTGSTGAGQGLSPTSHFSWRHANLSVYKAFEHQHLREIGQTVRTLEPDFPGEIHFIPSRGDFARGILATTYTKCELPLDEIQARYQDFYREAPFTHVSDKNIHLKQVVNTNKCLIYLEKHNDNLLIVSAIDNLIKGASGQAVQNLNLLFGLPETSGLHLKAVAF